MRFATLKCAGALLGVLGLLLSVSAVAAEEQKWGTLKGQITWGKDDLPKPEKITVDKDAPDCLKNGDLFKQDYVINPKTKGVRWVMVWLIDKDENKKGAAALRVPIHPALKKANPAEKVLDQPCCMFEPRVVILRQGDTLVVKNSAAISHNVRILFQDNPALNVILLAGKEVKLPNLNAEVGGTSATAVPVNCDIHKWMGGWVRVLPHPYFAVTDENGKFEIKDAPAGDYRLVIWQEKRGWVKPGGGDGTRSGIPVTIKADGITDLGSLKLVPEEKNETTEKK
jgi:hypothetical protein